MKLCFTTWLLALSGASSVVAGAQLQLLAAPETQCLFGGDDKIISVTFSNAGDKTFNAAIRTRIFQTTSATAVQFAELPWKKLIVQSGQTVVESARLDFPAVNAETQFLVQWQVDSNHIIGQTEVLVYPTNLLQELGPLAGADGPGVFDPQNQLKPLLKNRRLAFTDLEDSGLEHFSGRLVIIGPFASRSQMRPGLSGQIKALAKRNLAVVWLLPPPEKRDKPAPSFYYLMGNTNAVVVAQADQVSRLPENPRAQLNLIYFCKLALKPEPPDLPNFQTQP